MSIWTHEIESHQAKTTSSPLVETRLILLYIALKHVKTVFSLQPTQNFPEFSTKMPRPRLVRLVPEISAMGFRPGWVVHSFNDEQWRLFDVFSLEHIGTH
jgi:hypothetical protein